MKNKLYIIPILLLCTAFSSNGKIAYPSAQKLVAAAPVHESVVSASELKIIQMKNAVKRGDGGTITIQGRPGVRYTIRSSFRIGSRTISVRQLRTGDSNGQAIFNWVVSNDTVPGTYPVTISGDGQSLNLNHVVLP